MQPYPFALQAVYLRQLVRWQSAFLGNTYPDPYAREDPSGSRLKEEWMVRAPEWLLSRWPETGKTGGWMFAPPRGVVGHAISAWATQGMGKYGPFKVGGLVVACYVRVL